MEYLLNCVAFVARHGHRFAKLYLFDAKSGAWRHKHWRPPALAFSLREALQGDRDPPQPLTVAARRERYRHYLQRAEDLAAQAQPA